MREDTKLDRTDEGRERKANTEVAEGATKRSRSKDVANNVICTEVSESQPDGHSPHLVRRGLTRGQRRQVRLARRRNRAQWAPATRAQLPLPHWHRWRLPPRLDWGWRRSPPP